VRKLLLVAAAVAVLAAPAAASPAGAKRSAATLVACDREAHTATFQGDMRAFRRAVGLEMRFALQTRDVVNRKWTRVEAPGFDEWLMAAPRRSRYVYDKEVENLPTGAAYRALVKFRWRSASGDVLARARHRTRGCRQPDDRADLKVRRVGVSAGSRDGTRTYAVRVVNAGDSEAAVFDVGLEVDGMRLPDRSTEDPLFEGEETVVEFEAPRCQPGSPLVATVDTEGTVDETSEANNVLTEPCPTGRRRRGDQPSP